MLITNVFRRLGVGHAGEGDVRGENHVRGGQTLLRSRFHEIRALKQFLFY